MAVAIEMNFRGASTDQYDQVIQKMGLRQGGPTPPGAISHFVTRTDDGIKVVDVWETKEAFEKFAEEQIGPYTREVGISEEPEMRFHDVHNYLIKAQ
jgi:heme-degrading monooxygenase HmoA